MNERDGATSQKVNICIHISIHCLAFFLHVSTKRQKNVSFILDNSFSFSFAAMLDNMCLSQTSTRTRNPLFRYRLHVSN
jgi:hypothetical protein